MFHFWQNAALTSPRSRASRTVHRAKCVCAISSQSLRHGSVCSQWKRRLSRASSKSSTLKTRVEYLTDRIGVEMKVTDGDGKEMTQETVRWCVQCTFQKRRCCVLLGREAQKHNLRV